MRFSSLLHAVDLASQEVAREAAVHPQALPCQLPRPQHSSPRRMGSSQAQSTSEMIHSIEQGLYAPKQSCMRPPPAAAQHMRQLNAAGTNHRPAAQPAEQVQAPLSAQQASLDCLPQPPPGWWMMSGLQSC